MNLTTGRSGLVLDAVVEDGNPADSTRALPMLERMAERYGAAPAKAAFDGGYASKDYVAAAKALGVKHAAFHRKRGIRRKDMTDLAWVYARLKRFRAGVEAGISAGTPQKDVRIAGIAVVHLTGGAVHGNLNRITLDHSCGRKP